MKRALILWFLAAFAVFGAGDDWAKVKALKSGTEIRVYKKGSAQPVSAQMGELTGDNLVVLVKKTETAIPRDQIDRIDARPAAKTAAKETTTTSSTTPGDPAGQTTTTTSTGVSFGSKPDFETVYRRPLPVPKK